MGRLIGLIRRLVPQPVKRLLRSWLGGSTPSQGQTWARPVEPVDPALVKALGFPACKTAARETPLGSAWLLRAPHWSLELPGSPSGQAMITVCTANYLYFARTLVSSFRVQHPDTDCYVVVADWDGADPSAVEVAGATSLSGPLLVGDEFEFMALKYSATDLCCALKAYGIGFLQECGSYDRILYLDSDIYVFQPMRALEEALRRHDFVVTPHVVAPMPHPDRFGERPSLGDLAYAGVLNAGMAGFRVNPATRAFVETWRQMVTAPGAFLSTLGGQMEQNAFNWVTCFASDVHVLTDKAYNVAYWNLHDRSLRWRGLDGPERDEWEVDGRPLVAYHFSGFSPYEPFTVSRHDQRHSLFLMPSLARLFEFYRAELERHGARELRDRLYTYARFPSGVPIDDAMRRLFKQHETFLRRELSPWTPEGEAFYAQALLSPIPYTGSLVPALFERIYAQRADLHAAFPEATLHPQGLHRWIAIHGTREYGYRQIFDRHRPVLPTLHGTAVLAKTMANHLESFAGLAEPLGADRSTLIERLRARGEHDLCEQLDRSDFERYYASPVSFIRQIIAERADLRAAYPDCLYADAEAFTGWLRGEGAADHFLPPAAVDVFASKVGGRGLARVFSYFTRNWSLMAAWPLAFVGQGHHALAQVLMTCLRNGLEFDLDDILIFVWTMDERPWTGLALTLELSYNACRVPSSFAADGQDRLLAPLLDADPRFRIELDRYRRAFPPPASLLALGDRPPRGPLDVSIAACLDEPPRTEIAPARPTGPTSGVNLFGYHKSPIGLGSLTHGLGQALQHAGVPVRANLLTNVAMDRDLQPDDFIRHHADQYDTNVFVSYPHLEVVLSRTVPEHVLRGRRNIVYLAWEQRDGSHYWADTLAEFDQIWALSEFAADSLRRATRRDVLAVPSVVDFDAFPPAAAKADVGLDPGLQHFLYVFDANSSIERKNPEAAIRAFARAFSPTDPVRLVMKISNARRLEHRERLRRMLREAPAWLEPVFILEDLPRRDLLRLVSAVDCYVSLHRAEGFGYTCAEAMAYGKPVIATAYSGNLQFMDRDNSFLVNYREIPVAAPDGPFQRGSVWAEADVDDAAARMRSVFEDRALAAAVGSKGREAVRARLSAAAVGDVVRRALSGPSYAAEPAQAVAAMGQPASSGPPRPR